MMENRKLTYLIIETAIIKSPILTKEDKLFYIALKSFRNRQSKRCFPSMARVIKLAGISRPTAYRCRMVLKKLGIIRWKSERGRKHSCHYDFILEDGNSTEISIALDNLRVKQIDNERTTLNSKPENHLNSKRENFKIGNERTTNHMNITKGTVKREKALSLHIPDLGDALEYFNKVCNIKHNADSVIQFGDKERIKKILKHHNVDWIKDAMERFMSDTDDYFNKVGRSIGVFAGQINRLASTRSQEIDWSKY
jgi:hypothetical protein